MVVTAYRIGFFYARRMPTPMSRFDNLHADQNKPVELRVVEIVRNSPDALSAQEVAGILLGVEGEYSVITSREVQRALPEVTKVLEVASSERLIRKAYEERGMPGERTAIYAKLPL